MTISFFSEYIYGRFQCFNIAEIALSFLAGDVMVNNNGVKELQNIGYYTVSKKKMW